MSFLATSLAPTGTVLPFAGASAPTGWLLCDGSAISRSTYANLFTVLSTTYGSGDGSTTFNVPNAQGVFLRGAGSQTISSISYSGTRGTTQGDQMQGHFHSAQGYQTALSGGGTGRVATDSGNTTSASILSPLTDGTNGTPRTGTQTHPANISVNYIIKI
jgi:microcystin-dependent protein